MEGTIYQVYNSAWTQKEQNQTWLDPSVKINLLEGLVTTEVVSTSVVASVGTRVENKTVSSKIALKLAKMLGATGIILFLIYFTPIVFNYFKYKLSSSEVNKLTEASQNATARNLPSFNPLLPKVNKLSIPSIGVDTDIEEATYDNYESALKKGVWRVSNFGEPNETGVPIILAAHRFGYLAWTNSYRHYNSFYNLPKVKEGDTVTIDWQQREYTYGVYRVETGKEITDYSADVILYTCESLSGEERIFVYAKLLS